MNFIENKNFEQSFKFEIDKKYIDFKFNKDKKISKETLNFLNTFKVKYSQNDLDNKIMEIKDKFIKN